MRRDGSAPVQDSAGRVYFRKVAPGMKWCAFHQAEEPIEAFPASGGAYCTRGSREYQRQRRRRLKEESS